MASISFSGTGGTCANKERIVQTVIIAATVIAVCFVAEIAVVAVLLARRRSSSDRSWTKFPLPEKQDTSSSREQSIEIFDDTESKQLPATPDSSISDEFVQVAINPPTPLLHTQFPSIPPTPIAPNDTRMQGGLWVGGNRLTVVSLADSTGEARLKPEAEADSSGHAESELVARLRARIHELEMQNKLRDASWYTSRPPPSYKSKRN
ncbi:hypothetical protein FB45DRAFT_1052984 [Roridomyces roridus]|uniref:Transmembrane protein n=1 Tax=Roridomyces roridus TaxID=1738132 RepID=A0AAD7CB27_9AGAR|nr:hypothetical protein FB45DRAFT_1052984 [Roridomyces roridus]